MAGLRLTTALWLFVWIDIACTFSCASHSSWNINLQMIKNLGLVQNWWWQELATNKVGFSVAGLGMLSGSFTIAASYTIASPTVSQLLQTFLTTFHTLNQCNISYVQRNVSLMVFEFGIFLNFSRLQSIVLRNFQRAFISVGWFLVQPVTATMFCTKSQHDSEYF